LAWLYLSHGEMVNHFTISPFYRRNIVLCKKVVECLAEKTLQVFLRVFCLDKPQAAGERPREPSAQVGFILPVWPVDLRRGFDLGRLWRNGASKPLLQVFQ